MRPIARLTIRFAATVATVAAALFLTGCGDPAPEYGDDPRAKVSIAYLKTLCTAESVTITRDIAVTGHVAANDLYGEFSRTIVLCDDSGGIEIEVDSRRTAEIFPIAARVTIYCTSLALGDYGGRIMLGAAPAGKYTVDRIAESDFGRYFRIDTSSPQAVTPVRITIPEAVPSLVGSLVEIDGLTFGSQAGLAWCDTDPQTGGYTDTERTAVDASGNTIAVRTIAECKYRNEKIPAGNGTLRGILEYFNGEYSLRITNHQILFPQGGQDTPAADTATSAAPPRACPSDGRY